jgi:7-cyano-7-deazaguanine reductase
MTNPADPHPSLTQLGRQTAPAASPEQAVLERAPNPHPDDIYLARFTAPEFTSLCPVTGQPDFAHLVIDYAPGEWLVESKSLKLYLTSFRNHGAFHEGCTVDVAKKIMETVKPRWLRIGGTPAAASRSTSSGKAARRRRGFGCRIREFRVIAGGGDFLLTRLSRPCV